MFKDYLKLYEKVRKVEKELYNLQVREDEMLSEIDEKLEGTKLTMFGQPVTFLCLNDPYSVDVVTESNTIITSYMEDLKDLSGKPLKEILNEQN